MKRILAVLLLMTACMDESETMQQSTTLDRDEDVAFDFFVVQPNYGLMHYVFHSKIVLCFATAWYRNAPSDPADLTIPDYIRDWDVRTRDARADFPVGLFPTAIDKWIAPLRAGVHDPARDNLHLPPDADVYQPYRVLMRLGSLEQAQRCTNNASYNFSVIYSLDQDTRALVRLRLLAFLQSIEGLVHASEKRDVCPMNFDIVQWG